MYAENAYVLFPLLVMRRNMLGHHFGPRISIRRLRFELRLQPVVIRDDRFECALSGGDVDLFGENLEVGEILRQFRFVAPDGFIQS